MRRIWLAIRVFFVTLFSAAVAEQVRQIFGPTKAPAPAAIEAPPKPKPLPAPKAPKAPKAPVRSDALILLEALQREARFVDFVMEPLAGYSDAQIGAAARSVHQECGKLLERLFELRPILEQPESTAVEVPARFDAGRFHLTGNLAGEPPFRGRLVHPGWEASRCDLPTWTGSAAAARVVAPVEVEVK